MDEFELITRCFHARTARRRGTVLGIGDDAALLDTGGLPLANARATARFAGGNDAGGIARRAFGTAFIRLAAQAVTPRWATLGLTLEAGDPDWIERFAAATAAVCEACGVELIGGDTTRGPGRATVFALGTGNAPAREPAPGAGGAPPHEPAPGAGSAPPNESVPGAGSAPPNESVPGAGGAPPHQSATGVGSAPPHEPAMGAGSALSGGLAPARGAEFAVRLSLDASTHSPEHALADIVSTCAAIAARGAEVRCGESPQAGEPGDAGLTLDVVARTDADGLRALRAIAGRRRISTTNLDDGG